MPGRHGLWFLALGIFLTAGCASEVTRYQMASDEGIYFFTDDAGLAKGPLFDAISGWMNRYFNSQTITLQKDQDAATLVLDAWAPIQVYDQEQLVHYQLTCKLKDKKYQLRFETGKTTTGFCPAPSNMSQLESYYGKIRDALKNDLASKEEKF